MNNLNHLIIDGSKYTKLYEFMLEKTAIICEIDHLARGWLVSRDVTTVKCFKDYNKFNNNWSWSIKNTYFKKFGRPNYYYR